MRSNTVEEEVGYNEAAAKLWSVAVWNNVEHVYVSSARRQLPPSNYPASGNYPARHDERLLLSINVHPH